MAALADAGQTVVASIMGLGAAGVAGGVVAMTWSLHLHQLQLGARPAKRAAGEAGAGENAAEDLVPAMNGNGQAKTAASAIEGPDSVIIGEQARYQVRRT